MFQSNAYQVDSRRAYTTSVCSPQYTCDGGNAPNMTARPPDTEYPHPPQPILYVYDYVNNKTPRYTDIRFSHTLPSRFASRQRRLAHPSHALTSPPSVSSRGARHRDV
jgi:hypothetical protein